MEKKLTIVSTAAKQAGDTEEAGEVDVLHGAVVDAIAEVEASGPGEERATATEEAIAGLKQVLAPYRRDEAADGS
jgi:hypothetical protein